MTIKIGSRGSAVKVLQSVLSLAIDGAFGPNTEAAVKQYQEANRLSADGIVGPATWDKLRVEVHKLEARSTKRSKFFDVVREKLFTRLTTSQVTGMEALLDAAEARGLNITSIAYVMATAYHETAATMWPIEEFGKGAGRKYGKRQKMSGATYPSSLPIYYGRGFVQLTWYENYEKAGRKLNQDFLRFPEKTLLLDNAAHITVIGMTEGWFTSRKLESYCNILNADYVGARRIINGTDRASLVAGYAEIFETAIREGRL